MSYSPDGMPTRSSVRAWSALMTSGLIVGLLLLTIFYSLPSNVLSQRDGGEVRRISVQVFPQGWAFFTKPPSEGEIVAYRLLESEHKASVESSMETPQARAENMFGLSRKQRAQGPEFAYIANQLDAQEWQACAEEAPVNCAEDHATLAFSNDETEVTTVVNRASDPTLCGEAVFVFTEPVRWSFRDLYEHHRLGDRSAAVVVECDYGAEL